MPYIMSAIVSPPRGPGYQHCSMAEAFSSANLMSIALPVIRVCVLDEKERKAKEKEEKKQKKIARDEEIRKKKKEIAEKGE